MIEILRFAVVGAMLPDSTAEPIAEQFTCDDLYSCWVRKENEANLARAKESWT